MSATLVVRTGTANLASVLAALRRLGASPRTTSSAREVEGAARVVLPGVGAFAAAAGALAESGVAAALRERIAAGRPTLAICLGMQLLGTASEESPGAEGLGVFPATARRFPSTVVAPQLGWNEVRPAEGARILARGYAYFANSYRLESVPDGWTGTLADHGGPFVAALERGDVVACQFHPELSGAFGRGLLTRWLGGGGPRC